jgi:hypothetical protein
VKTIRTTTFSTTIEQRPIAIVRYKNPKLTAVRIRCAHDATISTLKSRYYFRRPRRSKVQYISLADWQPHSIFCLLHCADTVFVYFFAYVWLFPTDWATATCWRNLMPTFVDRGVSRGQRGVSPTVVNLGFLDRSRYCSFKQLLIYPHKGWVDPVPDPLLLKKSGSTGNGTRDLWVCSEEVWPLDSSIAYYRPWSLFMCGCSLFLICVLYIYTNYIFRPTWPSSSTQGSFVKTYRAKPNFTHEDGQLGWNM